MWFAMLMREILGTFSDRMLMESDPLSLIEGMTIAGLAVGASKIYLSARGISSLFQDPEKCDCGC